MQQVGRKVTNSPSFWNGEFFYFHEAKKPVDLLFD